MDGKNRLKHVERLTEINKSEKRCVLLVVLWEYISDARTYECLTLWRLTTWRCLCSFVLLMMDGKNRLKHVERLTEINKSEKRCVLLVVLWEYISDARTYECLTLWRLTTHIGIVPHRQPLKLHFIYLFNKYRQWIF